MRTMLVSILAAGALAGCMRAAAPGPAAPRTVAADSSAIVAVDSSRQSNKLAAVQVVPGVERAEEDAMPVLVPDSSAVVPMPTLAPPNRDPGMPTGTPVSYVVMRGTRNLEVERRRIIAAVRDDKGGLVARYDSVTAPPDATGLALMAWKTPSGVLPDGKGGWRFVHDPPDTAGAKPPAPRKP